MRLLTHLHNIQPFIYSAITVSISSKAPFGERTPFPLQYFSVSKPFPASGHICDLSGKGKFPQALTGGVWTLGQPTLHCLGSSSLPTFWLLARDGLIPTSLSSFLTCSLGELWKLPSFQEVGDGEARTAAAPEEILPNSTLKRAPGDQHSFSRWTGGVFWPPLTRLRPSAPLLCEGLSISSHLCLTCCRDPKISSHPSSAQKLSMASHLLPTKAPVF